MKGLECSEIHFDKINDNLLRLEAEYYRKEYLHLEKIIAKFEHLEKYTDSIDCGPFGSNMRDTEYREKGILVVRPFNLKDSVVENDNLVYVSQELVESNSLKIYNRGTLLFSRVGDIKIGVLNKDRVTISPNIVAVTFFNEKMSKFSAIYFQSYYGFTQIKRQLKIAAQPTISTEIIQNLMIPNLPNLIDKIVSVFDNAQNKLQQSQSVYRSAEQLLLKSLGLENWQPKNEKTTVKNFSDYEKAGRLDAEYYQPKYEELLQKLNKYDLQKLNTIVSFKKSIEPGSECYQTEGVPFVRVSDVSKDGISDTDIYLDDSEFNVANLMPRKDTILFSKDGSVGIAYKLDRDYRCITSGALLHLNVVNEDYLADYLTLVLNSVVVQLQAERDVSGAIIQHWKPSEIEKVLIPKIDKSIQKDIADKVQESFRLRRESKELLECAKRAVEIAIEEGEEKALYRLEYNKNLPYPEKEIELQMVAERTE